MTEPNPVRVIAISGGKGGIGKTNVSVNLSIALAGLVDNVMLLDADLGLANVDVLLGLHPTHNLSDVIEEKCELQDVIIKGPAGIQIIPSSSGVAMMSQLTPLQHTGLINAFNQVANDVDILVVDTAAGISDNVVTFVRAAQEAIVVVCDEPTSITDAYALIKVLNREHGINKIRILTNMVVNDKQGRELFSKLIRATDRFLDVSLDLVGSIPYDENLRKAVQKQKSVYQAYPNSRSSIAFKTIAHRIVNWPMPKVDGSHIAFFFEKLIECE